MHVDRSLVLPALLAAAALWLISLAASHPPRFFVNGSGGSEIRGATFPKIAIDIDGSESEIAARPERIASLTLATDQILAALIDPARVVAVTRFADDPTLAVDPTLYPKSVARVDTHPERVLPLSPDLVFVAHFTRPESLAMLRASHLPLVRLGAYDSLTSVYENIERVARAVGAESRGTALVRSLKTRVDSVAERIPSEGTRPRVLYLAGAHYSAGAGTLIDDLIDRAGGYNCARDVALRASASLQIELAIALQPEVVLLTGWNSDHGEAMADAMRSDPRWQHVPAVANDAVFSLDPAIALSVTHHAVDAVERIHTLLYPAPRRDASR